MKNINLSNFHCSKCSKVCTELIYSNLCKTCSKKWVLKKIKVVKPSLVERIKPKINSLLTLFKSIELPCDHCKEVFNGSTLILHHKEFSPVKAIYDKESNFMYLCKKCYKEIAR